MEVTISEFDSRLLDQLNLLQPKEWQSDAYELFLQNEWQPWFSAYQIVDKHKLIGFGIIFVLEEYAWFGWIITHHKYRNQGIGTAMTKHLISEARKKGAQNFILTASDMGRPIYQKLGFEISSYYHFFKFPEKFNARQNDKSKVRLAAISDLEAIAALDFKATGEKRKLLLESHLAETWVYLDGEIQGYYISNWGNGLIIAENKEVGFELYKFRCRKNHRTIVVPEQNREAIDFLLANGFEETAKCPRMVLGSEPTWEPKMIFSRATGYSG
jgi:GNAT superfamily N-acetyltransferase